MKLTILFMLLVYYSLIGIFFIFASPYIGEGYTNNVEIGVINLENQTYYRIDDVFYEDFNQNYGGTNDWNLNNWSLKVDDAIYCKNDDNDDCIESVADSDSNFTYKFNIDLMDCLEDGIFVSGHIVDKSLGYGDGDLYLLVSNDNGITYNQYLVSQGQRIGSWQINLPNTYLINNLKLGFKTENMGSGNYYLDEIKVNCDVESLIGEEETDNDIDIGRFFLFLGFGVGLPEDTPTWFNIIFITWQTIMLMLTVGFLYQAIRGS
jgi:hypothetical protein